MYPTNSTLPLYASKICFDGFQLVPAHGTYVGSPRATTSHIFEFTRKLGLKGKQNISDQSPCCCSTTRPFNDDDTEQTSIRIQPSANAKAVMIARYMSTANDTGCTNDTLFECSAFFAAFVIPAVVIVYIVACRGVCL